MTGTRRRIGPGGGDVVLEQPAVAQAGVDVLRREGAILAAHLPVRAEIAGDACIRRLPGLQQLCEQLARLRETGVREARRARRGGDRNILAGSALARDQPV